jgi:hypothetical protein
LAHFLLAEPEKTHHYPDMQSLSRIYGQYIHSPSQMRDAVETYLTDYLTSHYVGTVRVRCDYNQLPTPSGNDYEVVVTVSVTDTEGVVESRWGVVAENNVLVKAVDYFNNSQYDLLV